MRNLLAFLLVTAYLFTLIMSSGHLAVWYSLTTRDLPAWFALGLAIALESTAFLLSLLSNSLLRESPWAKYGALAALSLVWLGNYRAMVYANTSSLPGWEILAQSLFVPVGTYIVAKVLGDLLNTPPARTASEAPAEKAKPIPPPQPFAQTATPQATAPAPSGEMREDMEALLLRHLPSTAGQIVAQTGLPREKVLSALKALEERGLVTRDGPLWQPARR